MPRVPHQAYLVAPVLAFGTILRAMTVRGDLWLDEIWSIDLTSRAKSWLDVFTALHHDNNHYLNSLFDYVIGADAVPFAYRVAPFVFSVAAMPVAYLAGRTRPERTCLLALFAASYLIAFSTTEARGYAPLVFFTLVTFASVTRRGPWWLTAGAAIGGVVSHLSFVYALGAFLAADLVGERRGRGVPAFAPALLVLVGLWWVDVRFLEIGGDAPSAWFGVVRATAGLLTLGGADAPRSIVALALLALGLWMTMRRGTAADRALFATAVFVGPLLVLTFREQTYLAPRYFLVPGAFALIALGRALALLGPRTRTFVLGAVAVANAAAVSFEYGIHRGTYAAAVHHVCVRDAHAVTTSDHDFRNGLVFRFYARRDPACADVSYANVTDWNPNVGWIIFHSLERPLPPTVTPAGLGRFALDHAYRSASLSGWGWALYRRVR